MNELNEVESCEIQERDMLAVVGIVERTEPIKGKDRVELVHIKNCGYTFVAEKIHKENDLVVYIKYDTICPKNDLFGFLAETKFRIKPKCFTSKDEDGEVTGKYYSQGICLPIGEVYNFLSVGFQVGEQYEELSCLMEEGIDLTKELGIKKYIPPVTGAGSNFGQMNSKGDFPTHILPKTDETNLASKTIELKYIQGQRVYITLKIEGSSLTALWDNENNELMVCSRNNQIGEHETNKFWQVVNKYNLKEKVSEFNYLAVQGELAGNSVQKNKLGIDGNDLFVFNIIDTRTSTKLNYDELVEMANTLAVQLVPIIMVIEDFNMTFEELQELADKQVYKNGELAEGIVVRSCEPIDRKGVLVDWSYKVLNRDYKL